MKSNIPKIMLQYATHLPAKVINHISPSQLGGCSRKHYYQIKHIPPTTPTDPKHILNMQTGFMWEQIIHDSLKQAKIPFMYHHKMYDEELNMEGELDFGILVDGGKEMEIWDSKTESSSAKKYRQGGYLESHEEYTHQLNAYAIMAIRSGFTVKRGGFIVIQRDKSDIEQFPFEFEMESIQKTMGRINQMNHWLNNDIIPPCDGRYCKLGMCEYGNPKTRTGNNTTKNTECCGTREEIERWRS